MVCLGNICRSPLAQGIAEKIAADNGLEWEIDSAGTSSWHSGEAPDPRSVEVAKQNGIDISTQRGRQVSPSDLEEYDLILAMDSSNYNDLINLAGGNDAYKDKIRLIMNFVYPGENRAVPDPYFDGGFPKVYSLLHEAIDKMSNEYS